MNKNLLPIHFAPLQGYTDAAYRQAHACIFGGIDTYYSPFVRMEHGEIHRKDIRDIKPGKQSEYTPDPPTDCPPTKHIGTDCIPFYQA